MTKDIEQSARKVQTIITTFGDDIYIIKDKSPDEIEELIQNFPGDRIRMPNGARVHKKSIATIQDYADYEFQAEQKFRHKRNQYLKGGHWHDQHGNTGIRSHLERITGEINKSLPPGTKKLSASSEEKHD